MRHAGLRRVHGLVAVAILAASLLGSPNAAGSPAPAGRVLVPAEPTFPDWIDAPAGYEPESTCDPVAKPGAVDLVALLHATYGTGIATGIVRPCTSHDSGHEEGRAVDWMASAREPGSDAMAEAFVGWLLASDAEGHVYAMARRLGVMYVLWNSRKFYLWRPGWTEYSDCLRVRTSTADDTFCHRNHVHVSLSWAGAAEQTSWWAARVRPIRVDSPTLAVPWPVRGPWRRDSSGP